MFYNHLTHSCLKCGESQLKDFLASPSSSALAAFSYCWKRSQGHLEMQLRINRLEKEGDGGGRGGGGMDGGRGRSFCIEDKGNGELMTNKKGNGDGRDSTIKT